MVVGADALDRAHRPRPEPGAGAVGDAEIHRDADERHVEPAEIGQIGRLGPIRHIEQGRDAGIGHRPAIALAEHQAERLAEALGRHLGFLGANVFGAQRVELGSVEHGGVILIAGAERLCGWRCLCICRKAVWSLDCLNDQVAAPTLRPSPSMGEGWVGGASANLQ